MKVSKAIKKIVALGVGATMMGATILGATAADLSNYPNFFLDGGQFDGVIVVRGDADSLAAVDIASNMMYAGTGASTTTTTSVQGDVWEVKTGAKKLEMANSNATGSTLLGEIPRSINTFIGEDELSALSDQVWKTNEKDYSFQQFLFFDNLDAQSSIVKYDENDDSETDVFFYVKNARQIARYKVEFTSTAESDITDSSGSADTSGTFLDDFEDTELPMWGKPYNVVQARRPTGTTNSQNVELTLMSGTSKDTLLEGESGTYTVEGEEYTVELNFVDSDEAKFLVNGEQTNKLKDGDTYILKGGKEIGVSEILYQDYAGGVHSATFYLGAEKIKLKDTNVTDGSGTTNEMVVGSETIDGAAVVIVGSDDNSKFKINTIELNITTEDDYFVGAGEKLSEVVKAAGDESEMLVNGAFDVEFKGLTQPKTHDIGLKSSSARRYKLRLFDGDGNPVDIPVAYAEATTGNISVGEESQESPNLVQSYKKLALSESQLVNKDDYFMLSAGTATDGSGKSYLFQYKGQDKTSKSGPKIKFKNLGSGETLDYSVTTGSPVATIKVGGYSFAVRGWNETNDDASIAVDMTGDGNFYTGGANITFIDSYGTQWGFGFLQNATGGMTGRDAMSGGGGIDGASFGSNTTGAGGFTTNYLNVTMTTPNGDDYDNQRPMDFSFQITWVTGPEVRATLGTAVAGLTGLTVNQGLAAPVLITPDGETEVAYGYTSMGTFIKQTSPSSDPQEYTLTYPEEQRLPQLFFTAGATTSKSVSGGAGMSRVTIPLTATKLPEEVTNVKSQHIITVGGPCANSVTAAVMYTEQGKTVPTNCAQDFNEGEAVVALYDVGDKVAMVVAGYSGDDTRRAGKVIASRTAELTGMQVTVQGTTASNAEIVKVK